MIAACRALARSSRTLGGSRRFLNTTTPPPPRQPRPPPSAARGQRAEGRPPPGRRRKGPSSSGQRTTQQANAEGGSSGIPRSALAVGALGGAVAWWYTSLDEKGNVTGVLKDASDMIDTAAIKVMGDDSKPLHDKLLQPFPDYMLGPDGKGPPTLVLSMEDTLVHTTWDRRNGYRVAKRPGVDHFLQHVIPYYEIVLVSELPYAVGSEMMYNLDAGRSLHHHMLCREALCKVGRGKFVKDLSYLNRDLSQVIVIDSNPEALERNPSNLCQISKYDDPDTQQKDTELQDLESFLFTLATQRNPDFREVLKRYGNNNVGAQYKEKIEAHQKAQKERTRRFKK